MSIQAVLPSSGGDPSGALAANERVERLQTLISEVERGPASFAAALGTAQRTSGLAPATSTADYGPAQPSDGISPTVSSEGPGNATAASSSSAAGGYVPLIDQAAARNGLDPAVLYGLIQQESGFDPDARSSAGALGLTQLMPGTASTLGVSEPLNPAQSIEGGARYLGQLLRQFGGNVTDALAGYNAGAGAVERYGGVPPYSETQQYVVKVLENAAAYRQGASQDATAEGAGAANTLAAGAVGVGAEETGVAT